MGERAPAPSESGQGLLEYSIILALIVLVVIGLLGAVGKGTKSSLCNVSYGLAGGPAAGTPYAVGDNTLFGLGNGGGASIYTPAAVPGLTSIKTISSAVRHVLALKNDCTVWGWGDNTNGELGLGDTTSRAWPTQITALDGIIAASSGGTNSSFAVRRDGTLWAWGDNSYGQLGLGDTTQRNSPTRVAGISNVTAAIPGWAEACALKSDQTVWCMGNGGVVGDGTSTNRTTPTQVVAGACGSCIGGYLTGVVQVAAAYYGVIALRSDGTVWFWGQADGADTGASPLAPVQVAAGECSSCGTYLTNVTQISADGDFWAALRSDGNVYDWGNKGNGVNGSLGNGLSGSINMATHPIHVLAGGCGSCGTYLTGVQSVSSNWIGATALRSNGTVWGWGDNSQGELGNGVNDSVGCFCRTTPVQMLVASKAVSLGGGTFNNYFIQ